jgi:hypothetical protein
MANPAHAITPPTARFNSLQSLNIYWCSSAIPIPIQDIDLSLSGLSLSDSDRSSDIKSSSSCNTTSPTPPPFPLYPTVLPSLPSLTYLEIQEIRSNDSLSVQTSLHCLAFSPAARTLETLVYHTHRGGRDDWRSVLEPICRTFSRLRNLFVRYFVWEGFEGVVPSPGWDVSRIFIDLILLCWILTNLFLLVERDDPTPGTAPTRNSPIDILIRDIHGCTPSFGQYGCCVF